MLYPLKEKPFEESTFTNPPSEYRATPFWAWNDELDDAELARQIDIMQAMGMGGFHMHSRTGMAVPYLSDQFMGKVKLCVEKARENKMLAWLYDEDRWPSGAAGGLVTSDHRYRARHLLFTSVPYGYTGSKLEKERRESAFAAREENGTLLARYSVTLEEGKLAKYRLLKPGESAEPGAREWFAYMEVAGNQPWYNNQAYLNTLDPEAVKKFVEVTHDRYAEWLQADFGGVVPAIFTDEPQFTRKMRLGFADEVLDIILPYTDDLPDTYRAAYGEELMSKLPELFWDLPSGASLTRYRYHDHISERFAAAFADVCGAWCQEHGILLTGHLMEEPTLESQTAALGDAMRSYRSFQLPGIDMLNDRREFTTAKQAQSAAHQHGNPGVLSELYGVTNWDFDFRGHKLQGDWQAALGVSVRVPHLTWVSMAGEAKRDYPASIGYQSPWWDQYKLVEDHHSRVALAMTRGQADVRIGVVHPVESYWLHWGPEEQTHSVRTELDNAFENLTEWLITNALDFDFISESLLPGQCAKGGAPLEVGKMRYDVILVPGCQTLRSTTLERLEAFQAAGGKLIFLGDVAGLVDAQASGRARELAEKSLRVPLAKGSVIDALEDARQVEIRDAQGRFTENLITQLRRDGEDKYLFIAHAFGPENPDVCPEERIHFKVRGEWSAREMDTQSGAIRPLAGDIRDGWTHFDYAFYAHDSLLLGLTPASAGAAGAVREGSAPCTGRERFVSGKVPVTLSEPNVLLLDIAEFAFDGGQWQPQEEILRIDNEFRRYLGWPTRQKSVAQPWTVEDAPPSNTLSLRFTIRAQCGVTFPKLALENPENTRITLNDVAVEAAPDGWYVDRSIKTVPLPAMPAGRNVLRLDIDCAKRTNVEWCYLLGDFGVRVEGTERTIVEPVHSLAFGDWTGQGLPFYGGNVTYHIPVQGMDGPLEMRATQYRGALLGVGMDGVTLGQVAYAPYRFRVPYVEAGEHVLDLTVYGSRVNSFGAVHNCDDAWMWWGPNAWRTADDRWSYEPRLRKMGVLISPRLTY